MYLCKAPEYLPSFIFIPHMAMRKITRPSCATI